MLFSCELGRQRAASTAMHWSLLILPSVLLLVELRMSESRRLSTTFTPIRSDCTDNWCRRRQKIVQDDKEDRRKHIERYILNNLRKYSSNSSQTSEVSQDVKNTAKQIAFNVHNATSNLPWGILKQAMNTVRKRNRDSEPIPDMFRFAEEGKC